MTPSRAPLLLMSWLIASVGIGAAQEPKRHCRAAEWPKRLPALDAVVDSAALFDLIDTSPESDTTSMVVSILYKEDGPAAVRLVEPAGVPSPGSIQFLQIMSRGLRRMPPPSPMGALRVRVRAGPGRDRGTLRLLPARASAQRGAGPYSHGANRSPARRTCAVRESPPGRAAVHRRDRNRQRCPLEH